MPEVTNTFLSITSDPESFQLQSDHMKKMERFTVLMFSKSCNAASVNEARHQLFSHGLRGLESIPPTQAALYEHIKRCILQASFIWRQALVPQLGIPSFDQWGWEFNAKNTQLKALWTTLADASRACALLFHCGCKKACRGNCKCTRAGLRCTSLCFCEGG